MHASNTLVIAITVALGVTGVAAAAGLTADEKWELDGARKTAVQAPEHVVYYREARKQSELVWWAVVGAVTWYSKLPDSPEDYLVEFRNSTATSVGGWYLRDTETIRWLRMDLADGTRGHYLKLMFPAGVLDPLGRRLHVEESGPTVAGRRRAQEVLRARIEVVRRALKELDDSIDAAIADYEQELNQANATIHRLQIKAGGQDTRVQVDFGYGLRDIGLLDIRSH